MVSDRAYIASPIGTLLIVTDRDAVCRIAREPFAEPAPEMSLTLLQQEAAMQIRQYFEGVRKDFELPLQIEGSDFDRKVWSKLLEIPYGTTVSYGDIAKRIGRPGASRAVGGAVGRNPLLIVIPCHRVIRKDGGMGGFSAGIDAKKTLLEKEGICYFDLTL